MVPKSNSLLVLIEQAVSNLVKDQSTDHAIRIAKFALDAIKAASETLIDLDDPSRGCVEIRVGFHVGPVVSNVGTFVDRQMSIISLFPDKIFCPCSRELEPKVWNFWGRRQCGVPHGEHFHSRSYSMF